MTKGKRNLSSRSAVPGGGADDKHVFKASDLAFLAGNSGEIAFDLPTSISAALAIDAKAWKPWTEPARPLPVDAVVTRLIDRTDALGRPVSPRISPSTLGRRCPYHLARIYLENSAREANMFAQSPRRIEAERSEIKRRLADVAQARMALEAIAGWDHFAVDIGNILRPVGLGDEKELNARSSAYNNAHDGVEKALFTLTTSHFATIVHALETRQAEISQRLRAPHLAWRDAFIEHLGLAWHHLTGSNPSFGGIFTEFVAASFQTIGGGRHVEWDRAVRFVLNEVGKRPEGERFDRIAKRVENRRRG